MKLSKNYDLEFVFKKCDHSIKWCLQIEWRSLKEDHGGFFLLIILWHLQVEFNIYNINHKNDEN